LTGPAPRFLAVGRIGRPHGLRGELEVDVWTDNPARFEPGSRLLLGRPDDPDPRPVTVVSARPHQARLLVRLDAAADRDTAARLTGLSLWVATADARSLEADSYYPHELVGLAVFLADETALGNVVDLIETGSADVIVVRGPAGEVLLPLLGDVIAEVDVAAGRMVVTPWPGMI
jgi:16S rRNA processing protein RimM